MVQGNAILVVDLGNSSTKGKVLFGKDSQTGKYRERKFDISNVFAPIDSDYVVSSDYNDATSTILRVDTTLNGRIIKGDFCNGELQAKEKSLCTIKPSASDKKFNLDSTVLSYRLAFLFACKAIMNMQRVSDFNQLDITWSVVTLLPPGDMDTGKQPLIDLIKNIDRLTSVYPAVDLPIKIDKAVVLPEGYCAYAGVVYDIGHQYRPDYKFLIEETVLVIDIGAGTTDILLISKNTLVQNSKYTITQGGNNVYQLVRRELRMRGLDLDEKEIKTGIVKGTIKDGSKEISIVDTVNKAKSEVAQKIVSEIQDFFDLTDIKARSVGYVLICGGGSMQDSDVKEIVPMSEKVIEFFKTLSPNSSLVTIPTHIVTKELEDGDVAKVEEMISPRELNLIGASILAEMI
jgi:hypothetical protein